MSEKNQDTNNLMKRPPVVVVMGHVDHGKTSLLDFIRKTNLASREAGGITQSIGAYEIIHPSTGSGNINRITFIDTPGHEAFSKMRERGAQVADLAILIVAADDSVQPQTKESINILNETKTPFVVAINKIDKPNADVEKTKNELMQNGVFLEGFGGNISWQAISAKQGTGINELLDLIILASELEHFTYDPNTEAKGVIIESKMDSQRGVTAIGILKDGILKTGKFISTKTAKGKIKVLEDFMGQRVTELTPSSPVLILGFSALPKIGEKFVANDIELNLAEKCAEVAPEKISGDKRPVLNLILKADVSGSLEALCQVLRSLNQEVVRINILGEFVGEISDGDVKSASFNNSTIIGFNTKVSKAAENLAKIQGVKIITSKIIYELIKSVEDEQKAIERPAPLGEVEILALFSKHGKEQLIGGKVFSGLIKNNIPVKIIRNDEEIGVAKITNLRILKQEITSVSSPNECGILIESSVNIEVGDKLVYKR